MKRKIKLQRSSRLFYVQQLFPQLVFYSVMAENEDTLQVEDGADYAAFRCMEK